MAWAQTSETIVGYAGSRRNGSGQNLNESSCVVASCCVKKSDCMEFLQHML